MLWFSKVSGLSTGLLYLPSEWWLESAWSSCPGHHLEYPSVSGVALRFHQVIRLVLVTTTATLLSLLLCLHEMAPLCSGRAREASEYATALVLEPTQFWRQERVQGSPAPIE